jgi:hypothetical protein
MAAHTRGKRPHNWKGGRVVDPRGYVLIHVGKDHPLADVRGYAYEHRLIAEKKIGRRLTRGEEVHHDDEAKGNNDPGNLIVAANRLDHAKHHRFWGRVLRNPGEPNTEVACACGCGGTFKKFDYQGRLRRFLPSHNRRWNCHG